MAAPLVALLWGLLAAVRADVSLPLLAAFSPELLPELSRALRKSISEIETRSGVKGVAFLPASVGVSNNSQDALQVLCAGVEAHNPTLVLSFLKPPRAFFPSLVGGYAGIPVLGFTQGYTDQSAKEVNGLYLSLDPVPVDLAIAVYQFLSTHKWYYTALVTDDSQSSSDFAHKLMSLTKSAPWSRIKKLQLRLGDSDADIFDKVSELQNSHIRVILLHCDSAFAVRVFLQARRLYLLDGEWVWVVLEHAVTHDPSRLIHYPFGMLALRLRSPSLSYYNIRSVVETVADAIETLGPANWLEESRNVTTPISCWYPASQERKRLSALLYRCIWHSLQDKRRGPGNKLTIERQWGPLTFDILNLVPNDKRTTKWWKSVGNVTSAAAILDSIMWLGQNKMGPPPARRPRFRVVTAFAPPFVKPSTRVENGSCLLGLPCLKVQTLSKADLTAIFADYAQGRKSEGVTYNISCCAGIAIELLVAIARDLAFDFDLYMVADGFFGNIRGKRWNGMTADLMSGAAHMAFSAYSITSTRSKVIDFSVPYFHSGVSCLTYSQYYDVPLSVFLVPFSIPLWVAIFASLNATAIAAALYEWFSPFGLNPWGRQRTKNFSLASALWVMWSLLFSHLVAFKAPKSWPNKVLINLWGCFSVIFLASYTANIAALFAGLFFHLRVDDFHDASLLSQRTGTAKSSAAEGYVYDENPKLWQHIQRFGVTSLEEGLWKLREGELDVMIGDTAVLNYFRGNDPKCNLHQGDSIFDDAYAVAMQRDFPLRESISQLILKYNDFGYLDQLQKKWYGRVPCFDDSVQRLLKKPQPLSIQAVAGAFIMLGCGFLVGIIILFVEHGVFKHLLPVLRKKPKNCYWRNPNLMFFSQKMYRFINTVELVSPHHSAKEIVSNLREGQIASLFQKSVKRKAKEEARRRRSKSQFFEMIQEIRKMNRFSSKSESAAKTRVQQQQGEEEHIIQARNALQLAPIERTPVPDLERPHLISPRFQMSEELPFRRPPSSKYDSADDSESKLLADTTEEDVSSSSSPSRSSMTSIERCLRRNGMSVSFDDVSSLNAVGTRSRRTAVRSWSYDDVRTLQRSRTTNRGGATAASTTRHDGKRSLRSHSRRIFDELRFYSMTKEEILQQWRDSERELLNLLRASLREKKVLEEKLSFIQQTLMKPP